MFRELYVKRVIVALILCLVTISVYPQAKHALLVGISDYTQTGEGSWNPIHGANDVELLYPTLKKQGFKIEKLCDKSAKAEKIRRELTSLLASCAKGDTVYVHFSCHGQPVEDFNGDEEDGWDESIVPFDAKMEFQSGGYEGANHITDDELHSCFQKLREKVGCNGFVCVVIDACHAGSTFRGDEDDEECYMRGTKRGFSPSGKDYRPRINAKGNFAITSDTNLADIIVLEACRSYQSNYEIKQNGKYYGPLSYYVNQTLALSPVCLNMDWVLQVKKSMDADCRLVRQNMVYETSLR